jgi:hypothetical protein
MQQRARNNRNMQLSHGILRHAECLARHCNRSDRAPALARMLHGGMLHGGMLHGVRRLQRRPDLMDAPIVARMPARHSMVPGIDHPVNIQCAGCLGAHH